MQAVRLALRATCGIDTQGVTRGHGAPVFSFPLPYLRAPPLPAGERKTGGCGLRIAQILVVAWWLIHAFNRYDISNRWRKVTVYFDAMDSMRFQF